MGTRSSAGSRVPLPHLLLQQVTQVGTCTREARPQVNRLSVQALRRHAVAQVLPNSRRGVVPCTLVAAFARCLPHPTPPAHLVRVGGVVQPIGVRPIRQLQAPHVGGQRVVQPSLHAVHSAWMGAASRHHNQEQTHLQLQRVSHVGQAVGKVGQQVQGAVERHQTLVNSPCFQLHRCTHTHARAGPYIHVGSQRCLRVQAKRGDAAVWGAPAKLPSTMALSGRRDRAAKYCSSASRSMPESLYTFPVQTSGTSEHTLSPSQSPPPRNNWQPPESKRGGCTRTHPGWHTRPGRRGPAGWPYGSARSLQGCRARPARCGGMDGELVRTVGARERA